MDPTNVLETSLEPVSRSLNADAARKLIELRAPEPMQQQPNLAKLPSSLINQSQSESQSESIPIPNFD